MSISESLSACVLRDMVSLVVGDRLGGGSSREVYVFAPDPSIVIKIEDRSRSFQNIAEYDFWNAVVHRPYFAQWFAPVLRISSCGCVLLMRRTSPIPKDQYPERTPAFFADMKFGNFGLLDGQFVCHDYGSNVGVQAANAMTKRQMKANWWEG